MLSIDDGGVGGVAVEEKELAAFDQVDRIGVEAVLPEHAGGRAEVAVLQGQDDHAIVGRIGDIELVVDQHGALRALVQTCVRPARPSGLPSLATRLLVSVLLMPPMPVAWPKSAFAEGDTAVPGSGH